MKTMIIASACIITLLAGIVPAAAQTAAAEKTIIVYYSRTGNTKMACQALAKALPADILEIQDTTDRSGGWGFFTGALNSLFSMQTSINPEHPDLAPYGRIIIAGPIWAGKLAAATRTVMAKNRLDGKKVGIFSTTNVLEKESSQGKGKALVKEAGGIAVGYWQVAVCEKIDGKKIEKKPEQIVKETLALVPDITAGFAKAQ